MTTIVTALLSALLGSIVGPIIFQKYKDWAHEKNWKKPRKALLEIMLRDEKYRFKAIKKLSRTIGATEDETRSLLIELGARGAKLRSGNEGWALISRAPLTESLRQIQADEREEDT